MALATIDRVDPGATPLADRLAQAARQGLVGRDNEIRLFDDALATLLPPFAVLWLHGPGGIGKSTLLGALRQRVAAASRRVITLDASLIECHRRGFLDAIGADLPQPGDDPGVLFVDAIEHIERLHGWLFDEFLPQLPQSWLAVCAGRQPPHERWRHDARWHALLKVHSLANLDRSGARALLQARGVDDEGLVARALAFARGHPLALVLLADVIEQKTSAAPEPLEPGGSVVQTLVERFVRDVPGARHLDALRVAAFVRHTTEGVLAASLGGDDARALFDWLRGLGFMRVTPCGLVPHELVRDVLAADVLWRDPERAVLLRRAAHAYLHRLLVSSSGRERVHHQADLLFVLRHSRHRQAFFDWSALDQHSVEPARGEDWARIESMALRHEGPATLHWLRHWWDRQRDGFRLFWNASHRCDGFLLMLRLVAPIAAADRADPGLLAALGFIDRQRALAAGDELVLLRAWMHAEQYQRVSAAINLTAMHVVSHLVSHAQCAWSVVYMADAEFWQPHFDGVNFARVCEADYDLGGKHFGAFVHDWRFEPAQRWIAGDYRPMPFAGGAHGTAPDARAWLAAVRQALRDFNDTQALAHGALAQVLTRQLAPGDEAQRGAGEVRERLRCAIERIGEHPRQRKFRDAVWHTYVQPMHKQEQVAAELGIAFTTFRYRLQQGIERVAAELLRQIPR